MIGTKIQVYFFNTSVIKSNNMNNPCPASLKTTGRSRRTPRTYRKRCLPNPEIMSRRGDVARHANSYDGYNTGKKSIRHRHGVCMDDPVPAPVRDSTLSRNDCSRLKTWLRETVSLLPRRGTETRGAGGTWPGPEWACVAWVRQRAVMRFPPEGSRLAGADGAPCFVPNVCRSSETMLPRSGLSDSPLSNARDLALTRRDLSERHSRETELLELCRLSWAYGRPPLSPIGSWARDGSSSRHPKSTPQKRPSSA